MNREKVKNEIRQYAESLAVCDTGFCHAGPFPFVEGIYRHRAVEGYACDFEQMENPLDKTEPARHLAGAKSFIVLAVPYRMVQSSKPKGTVAVKMAYGTNMLDYHQMVMPLLKEIGSYIEDAHGASWKAYCDISPFSDRSIARRAGLGQIGKNSYLIHPRFGLSFFIGYLLTDLELTEDAGDMEQAFADLDTLCGTCTICRKSCPNGAILGDGQINANRCISYLTQAKELDDSQKTMLNGHLYGCDICHLACPYHRKSELVLNALEASESLVPDYIEAEKLLDLSSKGVKDLLGRTAAGWRGRKILQRNAEIEHNKWN